MTIQQELLNRSNSICELCSAPENLQSYAVPPSSDGTTEQSLLVCQTCNGQLTEKTELNINHWRCLNDSMWSQVPAVQVIAWRMLNKLSDEGWARDLLDMLYLEDQTLTWAQAGINQNADEEPSVKHVDANGAVLEAGDTVTLIKDLNVKGGGFTAKRGTAVRGISLVPDTPEHIEGRVNGQQIVILTKYVKKT